MILNEENKLSEMLKEVGLELEDFSSENSFNQGFNNEEEKLKAELNQIIQTIQMTLITKIIILKTKRSS